MQGIPLRSSTNKKLFLYRVSTGGAIELYRLVDHRFYIEHCALCNIDWQAER